MVSLQRFRLNGIRDTGRKVGDGAYATVFEYDFRGLTCVGKKMHLLLYEEASQAQRADMLRRFEEECKLLRRLHHPNIVQFLGVHVEPGSVLPVLVMEYLATGNLSGYLDRHGVQPDHISYGILRDVALGLRYLHEHNPPIIHRDLSANNVLLMTNFSAKISDLGVAKILNLSPSRMTQHMSTKAPGTPCYMPPEALMSGPNYTIKIDSYSFGVLVLHMLSGEWPHPTDAFQPNPDVEGDVIPVTEVDRRAKYLEQIGREHPLSDLIRRCLSNMAHQRPEASHLFHQINAVLARVVAPPETMSKSENQSLTGELKRLNESLTGEVQRLRGQNESVRIQNESLNGEVQRLRGENESLTGEVQGLRGQNVSLRGETRSLGAVIETIRADLATLTAANAQLNFDNQQLRSENQSLRRHVQEQPSSSEVERLSMHNTLQDVATARRSQPQLHPGARLQWRRCADAPVGMSSAQVVVMEEKVYMGGGFTHRQTDRDSYRVLLYNKTVRKWNELPRSTVRRFSLAKYKNRLITVGGEDQPWSPTAKVFTLSANSRRWEKLIPPMPTARHSLSVITTATAIIAAGGDSSIGRVGRSIDTVEVYSDKSSRWYMAESLPAPHRDMSSVVIDDFCYFMGGNYCYRASLFSLIQRATPRAPPSATSSESLWETLPPTPLEYCSAVCLNGSLMAVGGMSRDGASSAVHLFLNSKWVRLTNADLPASRSSCGTAQLSSDDIIVVGGQEVVGGGHGYSRLKDVYIGTLLKD